jgi:hypothetical protein
MDDKRQDREKNEEEAAGDTVERKRDRMEE